MLFRSKSILDPFCRRIAYLHDQSCSTVSKYIPSRVRHVPSIVCSVKLSPSLFITTANCSTSHPTFSCRPTRTCIVSKGIWGEVLNLPKNLFARNRHQRHPAWAHFSHSIEDIVYSYPPVQCSPPSDIYPTYSAGSQRYPYCEAMTPSQAAAQIVGGFGGNDIEPAGEWFWIQLQKEAGGST